MKYGRSGIIIVAFPPARDLCIPRWLSDDELVYWITAGVFGNRKTLGKIYTSRHGILLPVQIALFETNIQAIYEQNS